MFKMDLLKFSLRINIISKNTLLMDIDKISMPAQFNSALTKYADIFMQLVTYKSIKYG